MIFERKESIAVAHAVARAAAAVTNSTRVDEIADAVAAQALELGAHTAHVCVRTSDGAALELLAHRNLPADIVERLSRLDLDEPLMACEAVRSRSLRCVEDAQTLGPEFELTRGVLARTGSGSLFCAPLIATGDVIGVLTFTLPRPHRISSLERSTVSALADMFAAALARARRLEQRAPESIRPGSDGRGVRDHLLDEVLNRGRLQAELLDSDLRLRAIFDHSFELIGLLALDGTLLEANRAALELVGVSREDVIGKPFWETAWWPVETREQLQDSIAAAASGEFVRFETEHLDEHGARRYIDFSLTPVRDDTGRVVLLVPEGRDITERKRLERLRDEWASIVAHDLRQPVNAIVLLCRLLSRRALGEQSHAAVEHIEGSARQLGRMVSDLFDVSRLDASRLELERQETDLEALLRRSVACASVDRPIELEIRGEPYPLVIDAGRIEQVVTNLMSNALKYSFADTVIRVELVFARERAELAVENRGPGIEAQEIDSVFEKFWRTRTARESATPGSGLGLYISRAIVDAHGGRIEVTSVPGERTTFRVKLPRPVRAAASTE